MQQNKITIRNQNPQEISISNAPISIAGVTDVLQNGDSVVSEGIARVTVPTEVSQLTNDVGYITSETDPTVPSVVKSITGADINSWNNKQDLLVNQVNIKSINNNSILGSGNLTIQEGIDYTAGTGIEIQNNVISNTIVNFDDLQNKPTIPTKTSDLSNDSNYVSSNELSEVAFTGDYEDLTNQPFIPSYLSDLGNDVGFITNSVDDLINYYNKDFLFNLLPKVSDTGSVLTLTPTYASKLQLTLSATELTQASTPSPDSPQDIHTISGSNKVVVCGKNLFNKEATFTKPVDYWVLPVDLKPNTQYTISASLIGTKLTNVIFAVAPNGNQYSDFSSTMKIAIVYGSGNTQNITFTTDSTWTSPKFVVYATSQSILDSIFDNYNIQLEVGNSVTPYTPYVSQEANIDLGDIEYCKIGTYEDKFIRSNDGTWQLEKNIGKVVLDGTENWGTNASWNYTNTNCYVYTWNLTPTTMLSNYYKYNSSAYNNDVSGQMGIVWGGSLLLRIDKTLASDSTAFKTWLSNNNTEVYYPLSTPTYTQITGTLANQLENIYKNLLSYNGTTNISQVNADLPFQITATTLKDISNL